MATKQPPAGAARTILLTLGAVVCAAAAPPDYIRNTGPKMLSYRQLVALGEQDPIPSNLQPMLTALLTTPFVNNEAFYRSAHPHRPALGRIGPGIRVVQWNIERGLELDNIKLAFTDSAAFIKKVKSSPMKAPDGEKRQKTVSAEEIKSGA